MLTLIIILNLGIPYDETLYSCYKLSDLSLS